MMKGTVNILLVDPRKSFLEGLQLLLRRAPELQVMDMLSNGIQLLNYDRLNQADIVIIDIDLPGMNGFDTAKQLRSAHPGIKLIALTMLPEKVYLEDIRSAGFAGFVHIPDVVRKLVEVVYGVQNDTFYYNNEFNIKETGGLL